MKPIPPESSPSAAVGRVRPLDWARAAGSEELVEREMRAGVRRRRRNRIATLGAAAVAVLVLGLVWRGPGGAPVGVPAAGLVVSAPTRETLPDGSVVELHGTARVVVEFSADTRRVVLRDGEAHFQVAKNPARPFVVAAGGVEVRAVGTAFSVQLAATGVEVLVTEGRVAVAKPSSPAAAEPRPVFLDAGQGLAIGGGPGAFAPGSARTVPDEERAERLAWRVPRLELNFTPLAAVLPLVNAHASRPIALAEPALGELKLSGTLRADNVPVLLQILASSYGVTAEMNAAGGIVLHAAR